MTTTSLILDTARYKLIKAAPYFAQALAAMKFVPCKDSQLPFMAVDKGWRCYYREDLIDSCTPDYTAGVIVHELSHLLRKHWKRAESYGIGEVLVDETGGQVSMMNLAGDLEIHGSEPIPGIAWPQKLPNGGEAVYPRCYGFPENKSLEDYADLLRKKFKDLPKKFLAGHGHGSGSDGQPKRWEQGAGNGPKGEKDGSEMTEIEQDALVRKTAEAVKDYAAKNAGKFPAGLEIWADSILSPRVDWHRRLKHQLNCGIRKIGVTNRTWSRVRERNGCLLPRWCAHKPRIVVLGDMSGSMEGSPMRRVWSEIIALARITGEVDVIWFDCAPALQKGVRRLADLKPVGRGGTEPGPALIMADELKPAGIVVMTDGECSWPKQAPKHPCSLVMVGARAGSAPPWARDPIYIDA